MLHVVGMNKHTFPVLSVSAALWAACGAASAQIGEYDFNFNAATSGISGTITSGLATTGTLVGNYNATDNPTGTRTKPGLFGTFGPTENVAVPVSLGGGLNGDLDSATSGAFRFDVNTATGQLSLLNYEADFLSGGSLDVPVTVSMEFDTFRTRSPSSTYIGGIPLTLPIGSASVTSFGVRQVGPSLGTVVANQTGGFDFVVAPLVELTLSFSLLGNDFTLPVGTVPFALAGQLSFDGDSARVDSLSPLEFSQAFQVNQAIPQFAFDLPTVLPPGGTASLLFDLTLNSISADFAGQLETHATGRLVPAPGSALILMIGNVMLRRRRY